MRSADRFLSMSFDEARGRGIAEFDVILVTADAYVDHPSFGAAIVGRYLESLGLAVGIISQPDWRSTRDFTRLGRPRLFFGVTAGNLDSMVALYTASRKPRSEDAYSEAGATGRRPYLASVVYSQRLKEAWRDAPVILGGVEASLRRFCHYDYYQDRLRPSILLDAKADLLVYGNAEGPLREIVDGLRMGRPLSSLTGIRGTAVPVGTAALPRLTSGGAALVLPSFEKIVGDRRLFMTMTRTIFENSSPYNARPLLQSSAGKAVLVNPPALPLSTRELDRIYELPFTRRAHPSYQKEIPALRTVEFSFVSHRGCFGGCAFCSLYSHQGKFIQSRSPESVERELAAFVAARGGGAVVVTDVGGPTANMYGLRCTDEKARSVCRRRSCLYPSACVHLATDQKQYGRLLDRLAKRKDVKAVYVNSGVRYDLALRDREFLRALVGRHVQGRLSAAPEHADAAVLKLMGKPGIEVFDRFVTEFHSRSGEAGRTQFVVPYFIIGHPGSDAAAERRLADYVKKKKIRADQIQEFYPTPLALSTAMYYSGLDPDGRPIPVERRSSVKKQWKAAVQGPSAGRTRHAAVRHHGSRRH